jgi:hypothetical protein
MANVGDMGRERLERDRKISMDDRFFEPLPTESEVKMKVLEIWGERDWRE